MTENRILLLLFHPRFENSVSNQALINAASTLKNITIRDMYELYPDYNVDLQIEKAELLAHDIVIWQHPFYWYSCPPLMKQWIDIVMEHGWAYGKGGDKLAGKAVMNVITSGVNFEVYQKQGRNRFTYRELLAPFDQTAYLCNMKYLPPFIVPGANKIPTNVLEDYAVQYVELLNFLQNPQLDFDKLVSIEYFNQIISNKWQ